MSQIRVGVKGYDGSQAVVLLSEMSITVDAVWVEIDGQRYESIVSVKTKAKRGAQVAEVTFLGGAVLVPLDKFGGVLGDAPSPEWVKGMGKSIDHYREQKLKDASAIPVLEHLEADYEKYTGSKYE